jgi:hypothetical protein
LWCKELAACPYSFSTKNGTKLGSTGGGEKPRLHLKDKFFREEKFFIEPLKRIAPYVFTSSYAAYTIIVATY